MFNGKLAEKQKQLLNKEEVKKRIETGKQITKLKRKEEKMRKTICLFVIFLMVFMTAPLVTGQDDLKTTLSAIDESETQTLADPLQNCYNQPMFKFNHWLWKRVLKPVAAGWQKAVPSLIRENIANIYGEARSPFYLANLALQGRGKDFLKMSGRIAINLPTVGIGDPASRISDQLKEKKTSLKLTFRKWGVGPGFYFVQPIKGPSTLTDTVADLVENAPLIIFPPAWIISSASALETVNNSAESLQQFEFIEEAAVDLYPSVKEAYNDSSQHQAEKE